MKRVNLRLDVTEGERDLIRKAAALSGYRSMAAFCRIVILDAAKRSVRDVKTETADREIESKDE